VAETGTRLTPTPDDPNAGRPAPPRADAGAAQHGAGHATGYQGGAQAHPGGTGTTTGGSRPRGPSGRIRWLLFAIAVVAAAVLIWFLVPKGEAPQPQGRGGFGGGPGGGRFGGQPTTVGMATVARGEVPIYLNALGTVTPVSNVIVRSQIAGQLMSVGFHEGQMVTKGQFLAQIDPRPYQQQLAQAEGVLARDQAQLSNARIQLERFQTLLAQDSIARQDVDNQAATVRQLEGVIKSDQAAIDAQKLNLTYARITAPVSGRIGLRQIDPGNYVSVGDANGLLTITQIAPIDVTFSIPEDNLPQVAARVRTGATLEAVALDRAQKNELARGSLLTLDNAVDTTTGTVKAKARFTNGGGELFPNQFVNIRLLVETLRDAMLVPSSSVLRGSQGLFVYVIQPDRTVTVRQITTGATSGDRTVVTSGLQAGEQVVTDGTDRLREGAQVVLPGDCIPNMATGGGRSRGGQGRPGGAGGPGGPGAGGPGGGGPRAGAAGGAPGAEGMRQGGPRNGAGRQGGQGANGCPPGQIRAGAQMAGAGGGATGGAGGGVIPASPGPVAPPPGAAQDSGLAPARQAPGAQARGAAPQQGPGGPGQGGGFGGMRLLDQLNLDAGQQAKAQAIFAEARTKAAAAGDDQAARRQIMAGAMDRITPLLRPDQKAKFDDLRARQAQGGGFGGGRPGGFGGGQAAQGQ